MKKIAIVFFCMLAVATIGSTQPADKLPALLGPPNAVAWMNVATVGGGGVPVDGGTSFGEGDLLSERWGAVGTWSPTTEGTNTITYDDTTYSGSGFDGSQLKVLTGSGGAQAYITKALSSAQSAVYFRFYYVCASEGYGDGDAEIIFALSPTGEDISNATYLQIKILQLAGQLKLRGSFSEETGWSTGDGDLDISTGTVYKIEGKITDDGETGTIEWKVDGTVRGNRTSFANYGTVSIQNIHIGTTYNSAAVTHHFDNLDISSTAYLTDTL